MVRALILILVVTLPAAARDFGRWNHQPSLVRQWFQSLTQILPRRGRRI
jgi:hypothetical protein